MRFPVVLFAGSGGRLPPRRRRCCCGGKGRNIRSRTDKHDEVPLIGKRTFVLLDFLSPQGNAGSASRWQRAGFRR